MADSNTDAQSTQKPIRPVVLCILDGWGHRAERDNNAIALANTPTWDRWISDGGQPHALIETSGSDVGLPIGQMGNSEVGHMNIGAGRVVLQDLPQIDAAVADGSLAQRPALQDLIATLKSTGGACHLMGLLSPGGVHSHQDHMVALAHEIARAGVPVKVHAFLDGRDTPPQSAKGYVEKFLSDILDNSQISLVTVGGRYFGMDRDNRWDRVERAYAAIVWGEGKAADDPIKVIESAYAQDVTDEFIEPAVLSGYEGIKAGDGLLVANFRADRVRQILTALTMPDFEYFERRNVPDFSVALGMSEYSAELSTKMKALFPSEVPKQSLGEVVSGAGLKQLRIAETEKYAHVTFFLNGGTEQEFPGEKRILVPSPKVATYDLQPEMSAPEVTDKLIGAIESDQFDMIVVNFANGDMVGHTGVLEAAIEAAGTLDTCLSRVEAAVKATGGALLVTADHGNCELMVDPDTAAPHTAHTIGRVPVVLVGGDQSVSALHNGRLADLAPTVLDLMGLPQPQAMTGASLIERRAEAPRRAAE